MTYILKYFPNIYGDCILFLAMLGYGLGLSLSPPSHFIIQLQSTDPAKGSVNRNGRFSQNHLIAFLLKVQF